MVRVGIKIIKLIFVKSGLVRPDGRVQPGPSGITESILLLDHSCMWPRMTWSNLTTRAVLKIRSGLCMLKINCHAWERCRFESTLKSQSLLFFTLNDLRFSSLFFIFTLDSTTTTLQAVVVATVALWGNSLRQPCRQ